MRYFVRLRGWLVCRMEFPITTSALLSLPLPLLSWWSSSSSPRNAPWCHQCVLLFAICMFRRLHSFSVIYYSRIYLRAVDFPYECELCVVRMCSCTECSRNEKMLLQRQCLLCIFRNVSAAQRHNTHIKTPPHPKNPTPSLRAIRKARSRIQTRSLCCSQRAVARLRILHNVHTHTHTQIRINAKNAHRILVYVSERTHRTSIHRSRPADKPFSGSGFGSTCGQRWRRRRRQGYPGNTGALAHVQRIIRNPRTPERWRDDGAKPNAAHQA